MNGYVVERDNRYCAVIYEGLDPATERERRHWHPAGRNREETERAAAALADQYRRRLPRGPFSRAAERAQQAATPTKSGAR